MLDGLQKELLSITNESKAKAAGDAEVKKEEESSESEGEWMEMGENNRAIKHNNDETGNMEKSFVTDIFGGIFKSELTAQGKTHTSATYEPFYVINLDISQVDTVIDALKLFFSEEELSGILCYNYINRLCR